MRRDVSLRIITRKKKKSAGCYRNAGVSEIMKVDLEREKKFRFASCFVRSTSASRRRYIKLSVEAFWR
jgi:hypothetical protein